VVVKQLLEAKMNAVKRLLKIKPNVNVKDDHRNDSDASLSGHKKIMRQLLEATMDVHFIKLC